MLERPHRARPAVARLDLVGDEQDPVLVGKGPQRLQERRWCRNVATLAEDGLDQDRADRGGRDDSRQE